ncbi:dehydrogenase [Glaciihabitans sp. dw_435]|uniref:dehydrogenase n=1 Tax=Glaciihabitans sp. dw_435 TaxID=2720081 RepID=UPI001BD2E810|nr:dehydrogenase [Glaciihabitans sp. dw_435]
MATNKKRVDPKQFSSEQLASALEAQDTVAVALALRNDGVVVPLLEVDGPPQVRVFRRGDADKYMLLLFSSAQTYALMTPSEEEHRVVKYDAPTLLEFLQQNEGVLEAVWFDVAGPHAMQAAPADVIEALAIPRAE